MPIAIVFGALILGLSVLGATWELTRALEELTDQLCKRKHTYPTANGIEDATAIAIEALLEEQAQGEYRAARIRQLHQVLTDLRAGPLAYDSEKPNGKKPRHQSSGDGTRVP